MTGAALVTTKRTGATCNDSWVTRLSGPTPHQIGYFMNCCRETTKMDVPPGNRPAAPRDWFPYLNGTSQGPTPEDARKDGDIRGRSK